MSLAVLEAEAQGGKSRKALTRLLSGRADVGEIFSVTLRRLDARWGADDVELWAAGALALVHANAGGRCLGAFFRLTQARVSDQDAAALAVDARGAAEVARHAGSVAALASLEATPAAMLRLAEQRDRAHWWAGLVRLAREAPDCVLLLAAAAPTVLAASDGEAFESFVAAGLKAAGPDGKKRAAFFTLADPAARRLLERAGGKLGFEDVERRLKLLGRALWGTTPRLGCLEGAAHAPAPQRVSIAGGLIRMPHVFRGVAPAWTEPLYRAALAHAQAHLTFGTRQSPKKLRPLQIAMIGLIEDARVEALAMRRFPGLRALWAPWHKAAPGDAMTAAGHMARLSRALIDPDYEDTDGFVEKGRRLFAEAQDRLDDQTLSRAIGGLLGHDIGQMRLRFDPKAYVVEPIYRDDNLHLWDADDPPDEMAEEIEQAVDAARPTPQESDDGRENDEAPKQEAGRAREVPADERGRAIATYPEWDRAAGAERPAWTTVRDTPAPLGDAVAFEAALDRLVGFSDRVARLVRGARVGRAARLKRQPEGFDLDLDAAVDAAIALRIGDLPDERIHRASGKRARDVATVVLVDVSESTRDSVGASSVLEIEKLAVAALAKAMDATGDAFAVRAFASCGREDVRLIRLKDFFERFDAQAMARLAGLTPGLSTRLGAALRHVGAELETVRSHRKLVIALTDGEPSDIDVSDPLDLAEDARRATLSLRRRGVDVFGVTLGEMRSSAVFGRANTIPARRLEELPVRLSELYFRLARL
jgi:nitric oxide reductase NorD protein